MLLIGERLNKRVLNLTSNFGGHTNGNIAEYLGAYFDPRPGGKKNILHQHSLRLNNRTGTDGHKSLLSVKHCPSTNHGTRANIDI